MVERLCYVVMKSAKGGNAAGNVTSAGWQVVLCDPIWHVSSCSSEACCELLYPVTLLTYLLTYYSQIPATYNQNFVQVHDVDPSLQN